MDTLRAVSSKMLGKLNTLLLFIAHIIPELLIMLGLFFVVKTTFKINEIAGMYLTGVILILAGLFLAKDRR